MTSPNNSDESQDNPFEVSAGSLSEDAFGGSSADASGESRFQMPPVEGAYWTGVSVLGLMILVFCGISALGIGAPVYGMGAVVVAMIVFAMTLLFFALPLSLVRLWIHRSYIARAIQDGRYPGGQRFGLGYLFQSLILSAFCCFGGGVIFFGICAGGIVVSEAILNRYVEFIGPPLFLFDGIISLIATIYLLRLGIPKYQ
ncbi:MAG: hypothetical protein ACK6AO_01710 [Planctomycetota bacterium]|jgi:hypothetical protein